MHISNRNWIEKNAILNKNVSFLDVGSYIVDGQEQIQCRKTIASKVKKYIGLDAIPGHGVDIVSDAKKMPFEDCSFDIVSCLDTLEHVDWPREVVRECFRVTKVCGVLFLASVFRFPIHYYPNDYWRFTPACIKLLLEDAGYQVLEYGREEGTDEYPVITRGRGIKTA